MNKIEILILFIKRLRKCHITNQASNINSNSSLYPLATCYEWNELENRSFFIYNRETNYATNAKNIAFTNFLKNSFENIFQIISKYLNVSKTCDSPLREPTPDLDFFIYCTMMLKFTIATYMNLKSDGETLLSVSIYFSS